MAKRFFFLKSCFVHKKNRSRPCSARSAPCREKKVTPLLSRILLSRYTFVDFGYYQMFAKYSNFDQDLASNSIKNYDFIHFSETIFITKFVFWSKQDIGMRLEEFGFARTGNEILYQGHTGKRMPGTLSKFSETDLFLDSNWNYIDSYRF